MARYLVGSETVGVVTATGSSFLARGRAGAVSYEPGGIAHAVDASSRRPLCGCGAEGLTIWSRPWTEAPFALTCRACASMAALDGTGAP